MLQFSLHKKLHTADGEMQLAIDGTINNGEFVSLYGPSGAGKTSILRMLAGFMQPEKGFVKIENNHWFNSTNKFDLTPQQRSIGFVFQDYALFPNMSVRENIAFALTKNEPDTIVEELLVLTGLINLANRKIQTLSGGQQQRVALARAIAKKPKLLLLDEPLAAIDNTLREQLQDIILQLHKKYHLTTILVSHDMEEIVKLSDKIIHLDIGKTTFYRSPNDFLIGIGHFEGLVGNVLAVEENGSHLNIFVRNSILNVPITTHTDHLKKGDLITIEYNSSGNVSIKKYNNI